MYCTSTAKRKGESHVCNRTRYVKRKKSQTANNVSRGILVSWYLGILELTADCATDRTANNQKTETMELDPNSKIKPTPFDARRDRMISEWTGIADAIAMRERRRK
jgi:hypothetical protein